MCVVRAEQAVESPKSLGHRGPEACAAAFSVSIVLAAFQLLGIVKRVRYPDRRIIVSVVGPASAEAEGPIRIPSAPEQVVVAAPSLMLSPVARYRSLRNVREQAEPALHEGACRIAGSAVHLPN